jgi:predicted DNA-binding transcriptional regulator AlpA
MTPEANFLTRKQLSERLNISQNTLANWLCQGRGPKAVHFGSAVRYDPREAERYAADPVAYERAKRKQRRQRAGSK